MIPQPLTLLIPAIAVAIAAWLKDAALPRWANYSIVIAAFLAAVAASIILSGGLTGNVNADLALIITEALAVFAIIDHVPTTSLRSPLVRRPYLARRIVPQGASSQAVSSVPQRASRQDYEDTMPIQAMPKFNVPQRPLVRITPPSARPLRPAQPSAASQPTIADAEPLFSEEPPTTPEEA